MNWKDIKDKAELIYASIEEDKGFRTWSLKRTTCNIFFYEEFQIEDIDKIACSVLSKHGGILDEVRFATILGFNVVENYQVTPKKYADKAELEVYKALIQQVMSWGLVNYIDNSYVLSKLGEKALIKGKKYRFYSGKKVLFENSNIKPINSLKNLFFPFNSAIGVYSDVTNKLILDYNNLNVEEVFSAKETDLIKRHKLQSKEEYFIYYSEETRHFSFDSCQVDIRLYKNEGNYIPIIFHKGIISIPATELLHSSENKEQKEKKIEWALYLKLIKDPNAKLDYETIIPFEDLVELDSLIEDKRLVWSDGKLFDFIAQKADANQWYSISNRCPIETLKNYLTEFITELDWTSLSLRIDDSYLIQNATKYPWNFEVITSKEDLNIEVIKMLLLIPSLKDEDWDWDVIMPQLDFEYIKSNIDKINFELSELTINNISSVKPLIKQYPSKKWNWTYISKEYDLPFILVNISSFSSYLNLTMTLNRAFKSEDHVVSFCNSNEVQKVLTDEKDNKLSSFSPNQLNYVWSTTLIDLLESTGYLTWKSGKYALGFECNPYLEWTYELFNKYHTKITTDKGLDFLSSHVSSTQIVTSFSQFNWNWHLISSNTKLINDASFVLKYKDRLDFNILLTEINGESLELIFEEANILKFLEDNQNKWSEVTEKISKEFIQKNINLSWDWKVLTKRFCSTIKIESLGNENWIDKWDWKYLTQNLDFNEVLDRLDLYVDRWDWNYISQEADKHFIISNLSVYPSYWNWQILLRDRLEKEDLNVLILAEIAACISVYEEEANAYLWELITKKFEYEELSALVSKTSNETVFNWDYNYFYNLPDFNPLNYLDENFDIINWDAFSSSDSLNKSLRRNKDLFSYGVWIDIIFKLLKTKNYKWNFKSLSKLDSINWNTSILKVKSSRWDWKYLSENSSCFKKDSGFRERFNEFVEFIDFQSFSKRTDSDISEELIDDLIHKNWDWESLSNNHSIKISLDFICKHKDKKWDWENLSFRKDIVFSNELFIKLFDKEWNWQEISQRKDLEFNEDLIRSLSSRSLDWELVSKNKTFVPNVNVLSLLKSKKLEWNYISKNPQLSIEVLWDYKELLNWEFVTQNNVVEFSDISFLNKYKDYLDWDYISDSKKFILSHENLTQFKNKLNWAKICEREDFEISEKLLEPFKDVLNWSQVSSSMNIQFTNELIGRYREMWDWQKLRKNPLVIERLDSVLSKYKEEFNCVNFLEKFDREPFIYHFTHLFNAVSIIKERKIMSRNKGKGSFSDAAGSLVERRNTAHNFARFYFRPKTPTQFYNECLGWDTSLTTPYGKSYYNKAKQMGLPKCPIPIFFKFDLKEVLMKMPKKCYYSTGNMQSNSSQIRKVSDDPNSLNVLHLYARASDYENYKQYAQQEFLIKDEFDFSTLDSFQILCYDDEHVKILKSQLGDDPISKKISSAEWGVFHRENRELHITQTDSEISIASDYGGSAYFAIKGEGLTELQILETECIQKETNSEILAYPKIKFVRTIKPIEVYFVDTSLGKKDWLIYKN
ncbi:uncharacterized protein DUF4433 [Winogradskyella epiphytica]|uniref:Uncharacterized protein DUF4433 n=1 Tax=Winogradskyella epiphytica TaxID=262005 RepID=A0A2V4XUB6_9FLAO|nr:DarT ssDNA thymidine ADP-ribosyltransferase family protein [Winogradskyella epiphytica]PYE81971.1 uncharacterized protein DUF4433 [Winogradskyella epiphytica]GGW61403.1 hypothetical protein GCM10008085_11200 [Winogradskyella epiphytica]